MSGLRKGGGLKNWTSMIISPEILLFNPETRGREREGGKGEGLPQNAEMKRRMRYFMKIKQWKQEMRAIYTKLKMN